MAGFGEDLSRALAPDPAPDLSGKFPPAQGVGGGCGGRLKKTRTRTERRRKWEVEQEEACSHDPAKRHILSLVMTLPVG
jgi:hypothetical protein